MAVSTDSVYAHKVFTEVSPSASTVNYPLLSDRNHYISKQYGVLDHKAGVANRAAFMIDPAGEIKSKLIYPKEVGRNIPEIIRLIEALQYQEKTGLVMPANWVPGLPGIKSDIKWAGRI